MNDESSAKPNHRTWLERISHAILREPQDREQLVELLRDAEQRRLLDAEALHMIEGVLEVSQMQVRDIMIPRSQIVVVEIGACLDDFLPAIIQSGHSRFPIIGEKGEILGILFAKDLLKYNFQANATTEFSLENFIRPATFVPESKRVDVLLKEFRLNHNHMAVVVDEYGGVAGLVTIEDVLEEIVGEIEDEHDIAEDAHITQQGEQLYTVKAITPIDEFNDYFDSQLSDEEFDTIGGLVMHGLGHLPKCDETIVLDNFQFRVLHSDSRRIGLLEVSVMGTGDEVL